MSIKRISSFAFLFSLFLFTFTAYAHSEATPSPVKDALGGAIPSRTEIVDSPAAIYLVTNTNDSGPGSLRQAILNANAAPPGDIVFNIPTTDPGFDGTTFTIQPLSAFSIIRNNITIDGSTQTAFTGDTNLLGPEVVLRGGFTISGDNNRISNLVITGIAIPYYVDATPSYNQILDNYIGTDATGTQSAPGGGGGIGIWGFASPSAQAQQNVIDGNLISGSTWNGITLCDADGTLITNNLIGVDRSGTAPIGNAGAGIHLTCAGSPSNQIIGNVIAYNTLEGIIDVPDYRYGVSYTPDGHQGNRFSQNSIFSNGGIGINLLPPPFGFYDEVTPNDGLDLDAGGNRLQNFPVITSAQSDGTTLAINGSLHSNAGQIFTVELFLNNGADPSDHGEGEIYLTAVTVNTDGSGNGSFYVTLPQGAAAGQSVTATATDAAGNTSEFSAAVLVTTLNEPPTAVAGGPYMAHEGALILLDGSASFDPDGALIAYEWDLDNDGAYDDAVGVTVTVTFADNGSFPVGLQVTDDGGATGQDTALVTVANVSPTVDAGKDRMIKATRPFTFKGSFIDPGVLDTHTITWDFGDGQVATGTLTPTHIYTAVGTYTVTLTVVDDDGGMGQDTLTIIVRPFTPPPKAQGW